MIVRISELSRLLPPKQIDQAELAKGLGNVPSKKKSLCSQRPRFKSSLFCWVLSVGYQITKHWHLLGPISTRKCSNFTHQNINRSLEVQKKTSAWGQGLKGKWNATSVPLQNLRVALWVIPMTGYDKRKKQYSSGSASFNWKAVCLSVSP